VHDDTPRIKWKMAIVELVQGADGHVRAANIRYGEGKKTNRPIAKLYPLEVPISKLLKLKSPLYLQPPMMNQLMCPVMSLVQLEVQLPRPGKTFLIGQGCYFRRPRRMSRTSTTDRLT